MAYEDDYDDETTELDAVELPKGGISVTVNMDQWLSGSLNDVLVKSLVANMAGRVEKAVAAAVTEKVLALADQQFQALAEAKLEEFFTKAHQKTNTWGEKSGESYTIRELLLDRFKQYLDTKVDAKSGAEGNYSGSIRRVDFMLNNLAHRPLTAAVNETVKEIADKAKLQIQATVSRYIAEQLAPTISVPALK